MTGADQLGLDRAVQGQEGRLGRSDTDLRYLATRESLGHGVVRTTEFRARDAYQIKQVARLFEVHRHAAVDILHLPHGADQQRCGDGDRLLFAMGRQITEFVVQAVLAADERGFQFHREVVTGECGPHQRTERLGVFAVAPAEVIQDRNPGRIGADGDTFRSASSTPLAAIW